MAKCSICGEEAVYCARYEGRCYCKEHFIRWFESRLRKTIRKFNFFGKKEHIIVAVSGGKDSLAALYYLSKLSKKVPGWKITALLIDEGIEGYRNVTKEDFMRIVSQLGVDYHIVELKREVGLSLDEMVSLSKERGLPYRPCTFCGVMRRYYLNYYGKKLGGTVLVTAHNLDDVVQTFLLDIFRGDVKKIPRLGPVTGVSQHEGFIKRVKLFYEVPEKEVALYSILVGVYPQTFVECPYARLSPRWKIREFLNNMEEQYPGTKYALLRSLLSLVRSLTSEERPMKCVVCGEPSSTPICRTCQLKIELGILEHEPLPPPSQGSGEHQRNKTTSEGSPSREG